MALICAGYGYAGVIESGSAVRGRTLHDMVHRQVHLEAEAVLLELDAGLGSQIVGQDPSQQFHAEAMPRRFWNRMAVPLGPLEVQRAPVAASVQLPLDRDLAAVAIGERAMLDGVGRELVKGKADGFGRLRAERDVRSLDR